MAIVKRGENKFLIRVYLGRDPITKKRLEINETFYGDRDSAEKHEQILKSKAVGGTLAKSPRMTVNQLINLYMDSTRHHLSKHTISHRTDQFGRYVIPFIGNTQIQKIKRNDIQRLLNYLLDPKKEGKVNDEKQGD